MSTGKCVLKQRLVNYLLTGMASRSALVSGQTGHEGEDKRQGSGTPVPHPDGKDRSVEAADETHTLIRGTRKAQCLNVKVTKLRSTVVNHHRWQKATQQFTGPLRVGCSPCTQIRNSLIDMSTHRSTLRGVIPAALKDGKA